MKITKIAIACFKHDMHLLRACVASIRYWYPDVEIYLIKDYKKGNFSTREIEKAFNVKVFPTKRKIFGWPWSKLEILLHEQKGKYLFLDSDIVFLGRVLDKLEEYDDDFIVTGVEKTDESSHNINAHYIDMQQMKEFDPSYVFPGYGFNGGQMVMTSGVLNEDDFASVVTFDPLIKNKFPKMLRHGDQGVLNYVFTKCSQLGKISVRYVDFWIWPGVPEAHNIELSGIENRIGIPKVMHWAGIKSIDIRKYDRYDILRFYEKQYFYTPGSSRRP